MDFYFELRNFLNIYDLVDEHYVMYSELEADGRFMLKLFCVDPSLNIQKRLDKASRCVFFGDIFACKLLQEPAKHKKRQLCHIC